MSTRRRNRLHLTVQTTPEFVGKALAVQTFLSNAVLAACKGLKHDGFEGG